MTAPVLDYSQWKLTLPVGKPGRPTEVRCPTTSSFNPWYASDLDSRELLFLAHAGGVTTPNSDYPRSELRELVRHTGKPASWDSRTGLHQLVMTARITDLPEVKPHLVCAQIHDGRDDVLQVRLEEQHLFLESDGRTLTTLEPDYQLGDPFTVHIIASRLGLRVAFHYGGRREWRAMPKMGGHGWYFKAGCYLQSNMEHEDDPGAYGQVAISRLTASHRAAA